MVLFSLFVLILTSCNHTTSSSPTKENTNYCLHLLIDFEHNWVAYEIAHDSIVIREEQLLPEYRNDLESTTMNHHEKQFKTMSTKKISMSKEKILRLESMLSNFNMHEHEQQAARSSIHDGNSYLFYSNDKLVASGGTRELERMHFLILMYAVHQSNQ